MGRQEELGDRVRRRVAEKAIPSSVILGLDLRNHSEGFEATSECQNEFNSSAFLARVDFTEWVLGSSPRMTTLLDRSANVGHGFKSSRHRDDAREGIAAEDDRPIQVHGRPSSP